MEKPDPRSVSGAPEDGRDREARRPPRIEIRVSWCKGCGLCVESCNRDVLEMDGALPRVVHAEKCSRCMQCEAMCPDFAIQVLSDEREPEGAGAAACAAVVTS